jgi:hypothetical protein
MKCDWTAIVGEEYRFQGFEHSSNDRQTVWRLVISKYTGNMIYIHLYFRFRLPSKLSFSRTVKEQIKNSHDDIFVTIIGDEVNRVADKETQLHFHV